MQRLACIADVMREHPRGAQELRVVVRFQLLDHFIEDLPHAERQQALGAHIGLAFVRIPLRQDGNAHVGDIAERHVAQRLAVAVGLIDVRIVIRMLGACVLRIVAPARHAIGRLLPYEVGHVGKFDEIAARELFANLLRRQFVRAEADALHVCFQKIAQRSLRDGFDGRRRDAVVPSLPPERIRAGVVRAYEVHVEQLACRAQSCGECVVQTFVVVACERLAAPFDRKRIKMTRAFLRFLRFIAFVTFVAFAFHDQIPQRPRIAGLRLWTAVGRRNQELRYVVIAPATCPDRKAT